MRQACADKEEIPVGVVIRQDYIVFALRPVELPFVIAEQGEIRHYEDPKQSVKEFVKKESHVDYYTFTACGAAT
jgi:hypothetical protein